MGHLWGERPVPVRKGAHPQAAIALGGCPAMDVLRRWGRKGYRRAEECATGSQCQSARATPPQPTIKPPRKGPGWKCMEDWEGIGARS